MKIRSFALFFFLFISFFLNTFSNEEDIELEMPPQE
jgi:hypothetical protein